MLYNMCHVKYITCVMLCYITFVMSCYITCVMLCYITCVRSCYITKVMSSYRVFSRRPYWSQNNETAAMLVS